MKKIKLYCLAYAGASAYVFNDLKHKLTNGIEVVLVDLPGKGKRVDEPFCKTMGEAVKAVAACMNTDDDMEYAVLGYSMGGLLAYEVLHELHAEGKKMPKVVFVAAAAPPEKMSDMGQIYNLSDCALIEEIVHMGGVDRKAFENKEYREFCMPILRADFKILGEYEYLEREYKPNVSAYIMFSDDEKERIHEWDRYFRQECHYIHFEAGHFFIHSQMEKMGKTIQRILK